MKPLDSSDSGVNRPENGSSPLRETLTATGLPLSRVTVLNPAADPFRQDTPANHRDAQWLADVLDELRIERIHNRGVHYACFGRLRPEGKPHSSSEADWNWVQGAVNAARWLDYISFERITDERNEPPVIRLWTPPEPKVMIDAGKMEMPSLSREDVTISPWLDDMRGEQPYHIVFFGEKSSLEPILANSQSDTRRISFCRAGRFPTRSFIRWLKPAMTTAGR